MNDRELWKLTQQQAKEEYEKEFGEGSWEEADKYEREDYVFAKFFELKGE